MAGIVAGILTITLSVVASKNPSISPPEGVTFLQSNSNDESSTKRTSSFLGDEDFRKAEEIGMQKPSEEEMTMMEEGEAVGDKTVKNKIETSVARSNRNFLSSNCATCITKNTKPISLVLNKSLLLHH